MNEISAFICLVLVWFIAVESIKQGGVTSMINVLQNPFSNSGFQSARQTDGNVALPHCAFSPPASLLAAWNIKDEYIPSVSTSSGTYNRPSIPAVSLAGGEAVSQVGITDKMREEMACDDGSHWSAMGLLPVAYPTLYGIIDQVFEEKGIKETVFYEGCSYNLSINPDGVFIFHPDEFKVNGVDSDFAKEICLALESAVNSSSLNLKENPQLFMKAWIPLDYEPAKWGRTLDREKWINEPLPDLSGFIKELRSDICNKFSDLQIVDFSMKINDEGKLTITSVQTSDSKNNARALEQMNRGLTGGIEKKAEYLGLLIYSVRGTTHGDVLMEGMLEPFDDGSRGNIRLFKQEIVLTSGTDYKVVQTDKQKSLTHHA
ncbi:MAG: hypothetical protein ACRC46_10525 [Thermoguttaceae bacterium]